ncbi:MAG TPA: hypothetical protein VKZ48_01425 [Burkholderiales bacterium]|nr:hypothetical protein [Burkholderiales bacterium]
MNTTGMLTQDAIRDILEAGVWAPSAENRHAFRYSIEGDDVRLHVDAAFKQGSADQQYVTLLSLGAVIENMRIAASVHALSCTVRREGEAIDADIVLHFTPASLPADELAAALKQRHTNRRPFYHGPRLSAAEQGEIEAGIVPLGDQWLVRWFDEEHGRARLARLMREAETHRFANAELHQAMFGGIRFDVGWSAGANEGLPPAALHIEPGTRAAFAALRRWSFMRTLVRVGAHHAIAMRASYIPARRSPHLCVVASRTPVHDADELLQAGCAMERVWLAATRLNLAVQPMAAAVALARPGRSALTAQQRESLVAGWRALLPDAQPVMIFRFGRAAPPAVRAGRPLPSSLARR